MSSEPSSSSKISLTSPTSTNTLCVVCGEDKDVRNHYGVFSCFGCKTFFRRSINEKRVYKCLKEKNCIIDKNTRNQCRWCRFEKCLSVGMKADSLRDTRKSSIKLQELKSEESEPSVLKVQPSTQLQKQSLNLIDFLVSMNRVCNDYFDPNYPHITLEDTIKLDKMYGRDVSLEEGIQHPERVCPRIKMRWTYERTLIAEDLSFTFYRIFVQIADFANLIPQFRQLHIKDQCILFRFNFACLSWIYYLQELQALQIDKTLGYPFGNGSYAPNKIDELENKREEELTMFRQAKKFYTKIHKVDDPFRELEFDEKEFCLFKTLLLFQFAEELSQEGQKVCHRMNDSLIEALWVYQGSRFPESTYEERAKRQSKILLIIPKITYATQMESDLCLLMSIFGELNLDGIPKDLLFFKSRASE